MERGGRIATPEADKEMLAQFVAAFDKFDDLCALAVPPALISHTDEYGMQHWRPRPIATLPSALDALYVGLNLPGRGSTRFPPLYEALILSYRWTKVDLGSCRLLPNEPADDLSPLRAAIQADKQLYQTLVPNGYIQFGQGPDCNYDPVCFDFRHRQKSGDCRVVQLDHEAILCYDRVEEVAELAPNFRSLVQEVVSRKDAKTQRNAINHKGC